MWGIELQRRSDTSLARQIYRELRKRIMSGEMPAGEVLPSTRELAKQLVVSRNTALQAYEMLAAEGFIESRQGAATRIAQGVTLEPGGTAEAALSVMKQPQLKYSADFRTGQPDLRLFPRYSWLAAQHRAGAALPMENWGYSGPEGWAILRQEIAAWLLRSRGMTICSDDIYITAGATQALNLIAELLQRRSGAIVMEDPCHSGMRKVLENKGLPVTPVPADQYGLNTELLPAEQIAAVYVTPSHQFPLGGILPAARRTALVKASRERDFYIIEDDYDSEFRYSGAPVAPMRQLDAERVIYVGTFSKTLFPALRIGFVILPAMLGACWRSQRTYQDVQNPLLEQAALAEYMSSRRFDRHIRMMVRVYGHRRKALLEALTERFGGSWRPVGDAAGLHLAASFQDYCFDGDFSGRARQHGIRVAPVEQHAICKGFHAEKLLLGYGHLEPDEIRAGVRLLHTFMVQDGSRLR